MTNPSTTRAALLVIFCCLAGAQDSGKPLTFDVASVKPVAQPAGAVGGGSVVKRVGGPGGRGPVDRLSGGPGTSDPGRIHYPGVTLQFLINSAYDVSNFQVVAPEWLAVDRFDIDATMPPSTTAEQFRAMLQNLLADRFKLAIHRETKEVAGYSLVLAKNGPKLKESAAPTTSDDGAPEQPLKLGADGYFVPPRRPGVFSQMVGLHGARSTFQQLTMQGLASALQWLLKRPVTDATGLTAKYDFVLTYSPEGLDLGSGRIPVSPGDGDPPLDIFGALQAQLGLKLESKKGPVELVVVDHLERTPSGN